MPIGVLALTELSRPDVRVAVLSRGSKAVYLQTGDGAGGRGEIVWLAMPQTPCHRRAIHTGLPLQRLAPGMAAWVTDGGLQLEAIGTLALEGEVWHTPVLAAENIVSTAEIGRRRQRLTRLLTGAAEASAALLWLARGATAELPAGLPRHEAVLLPVLVRTAAGTAAGLPELIDALAGLGPGLTPAGDDVLGGLLFALRLLAVIDERRAGALAERAAARTHPISATILRDLAAGHGPAPLHRLAGELLTRDGKGAEQQTVRELLAIGHSSGGDLLSGFVIGLDAALRFGRIAS